MDREEYNPTNEDLQYSAFQRQLENVDRVIQGKASLPESQERRTTANPRLVRVVSSAWHPSVTLTAWSDGIAVLHAPALAHLFGTTEPRIFRAFWAVPSRASPLTTWEARRAELFEGTTEIWPNDGWDSSDRSKEDAGVLDSVEESLIPPTDHEEAQSWMDERDNDVEGSTGVLTPSPSGSSVSGDLGNGV